MTQFAMQRPLPSARSIETHPRRELIEFLLATIGAAKTSRAMNVSLDALYRWRKHRLAQDAFYFASRPPPNDHADKVAAARIIATVSKQPGA